MNDLLESRLRTVYDRHTQPDELDDVLRRGRRIVRARRARRIAPAITGLAAAAAVAVAVVPAFDPAADKPLRLVTFSVPSFPVSLDPAPPGLTDPSFWQEPDGRQGATYLDALDPQSENSLFINVTRDRRSGLGDRAGRTEIGGADATFYAAPAQDTAAAALTLQWERADHQWISITGNGTRASRDVVRDAAARVTGRSVLVPLQVRLAPDGWVVQAYKDDIILSLDDPDSDDPLRSISVHLIKTWDDDFAAATGASSFAEVRVNGRKALLVQTSEGQQLQARLPDGTAFTVQAPADLSRAEMVELGTGVSRP